MSTADPLGLFRGTFERLFEDLENSVEGTQPGSMLTMSTRPGGTRRGGQQYSPTTGYLAADVCEKGNEFLLKCDIAGCSKDQVQLNVDDTHNTVSITCERKAALEDTDEGWLLRERPYGKLTHTFTLPETADLHQASAEFKEGVLTLCAPKREAPGARTIQIK